MKKILIGIICLLLVACSSTDNKNKTANKTEKKEEEKIIEVSFAAAGDNLIHNSVYEGAALGDGTYDFTSYYEYTTSIIQSADIAFINQETPIAGSELGLSNYPNFNGPYEVLDALVNTGFDWINYASNHSVDRGEAGILAELEYAKKFGDKITITGINDSEESRNEAKVIERNGLKVGVTSYTYGLNGYELPSDKSYLVNITDKEQIKKDITALKKVSDVQIVNMHWGSEYSFAVSDEQKELAQYLSDLGVDVIIGEHPHVIEPMEYITSANGHRTLVFYSLGNFLSAQLDNYNMLGLLPTWTITYNTKTKEINIKDVKVYPTINWISESGLGYRVYPLKDYNNDIAASHFITIKIGQDCTREYFINLYNEVMGNSDIEAIY